MGADLLAILIVAIVICGIPAYFISIFTRNKLIKADSKNIKTISIITFIGSFILIFAALVLLFIFNVKITR
jgi:uncharacterized protein HemY